jgi:hypothetical protein
MGDVYGGAARATLMQIKKQRNYLTSSGIKKLLSCQCSCANDLTLERLCSKMAPHLWRCCYYLSDALGRAGAHAEHGIERTRTHGCR